MKKIRLFLLISLLILLIIPIRTNHAAQQSGSEVIMLINSVRDSNGLSPLEEDSTLSAAAQAQADHLAATYGADRSVVVDWHSGPNGSDEYDRALSAGYALGPGWSVAEIVFGGGGSSTANDALRWWLNSAMDKNAIYNADNVHIGAATSNGDGYVYHVVVFGFEFGSAGVARGGVASTIPTTAVTPEVAPVSVATPNEDGSVFHVVESGQALWSIAIAYDISIDQILALNNLEANAIIYEGQSLQVRAAYTPTSQPTETNTPEAPTRTPIPAQTAQAVRTQTPTAESEEGGFLNMDSQTMGLTLILISGIGLILIVVGNFAKERAAKNKKQD
jgi:LysM repeat protein